MLSHPFMTLWIFAYNLTPENPTSQIFAVHSPLYIKAYSTLGAFLFFLSVLFVPYYLLKKRMVYAAQYFIYAGCIYFMSHYFLFMSGEAYSVLMHEFMCPPHSVRASFCEQIGQKNYFLLNNK
jgi:hypothetical protein